MLNILTVRYFGISEFYLSIFKIFLMLGLIMYTLFHHDWRKSPS